MHRERAKRESAEASATRRQREKRIAEGGGPPPLSAARARGRNGGRPKVAAGDTKVVLAKKLHADKSLEIDDICNTLRISRSTFYWYVRM
jgi:hypothetical protein